MSGPLTGLKIVEFAGLGPAPFCAMMFADMGAEVVRIEKPPLETRSPTSGNEECIERGRKSIALDLKSPAATDIVLRILDDADGLIEGFRPGVMERLGLGPEVCLARNPRLVFGRMTGWGQTGPLAKAAGHDLNYIALSGALHAMGQASQPPSPPLHLVGDLGGGAMMLAFGMMCALFYARQSGRGQVIDAAICDGTALLSTLYYGMRNMERWSNTRESNLLDGGAHFYRCYRCADDKFISIGAIEPQFYRKFLELCEIKDPEFNLQLDLNAWPSLSEKLSALFASRTRAEWTQLLEGTDVCFAPVLDFDEAPLHPHYAARNTFMKSGESFVPAPAPRLDLTPAVAGSTTRPGEHAEVILQSLGLSEKDIASLRSSGAIR
jgi:alpha-methylacyl-CoA racemase